MKLHWSPRSPFVRKVMIVAHESAWPTGSNASAQSRHDEAASGADDRQSAFEDPDPGARDGTVLYDSAVICEYLDRLHDGPKLFPAAARERMTALRRQALGDGLLDTLVLWRGELSRPAEQQSQPYLESFSVRNEATLAALERETPALEFERLFDRSCRDRMRALLSGLSL